MNYISHEMMCWETSGNENTYGDALMTQWTLNFHIAMLYDKKHRQVNVCLKFSCGQYFVT